MIDSIQQDTPIARLPDFEPAADLWMRIEQRHAQRRRRRRLTVISGFTLVAVAAVAMFAVTAPITASDGLAEYQRESLHLERDWQALGATSSDSGFTRLRPFDAALQQALDGRVGDAELNRLWSERNQMLREMIRMRRDQPGLLADTSGLVSI